MQNKGGLADVLNVDMKRKLFFGFLMVVLFQIPFKSLAATGCYGLYMGKYYLLTSVISGSVYNSSPNVQNPGPLYCIAPIGGSCTVSGFSGYSGSLVSYNPAANGCSIDEEVPFLLVTSGILALVIIRRRKSSKLVSN